MRRWIPGLLVVVMFFGTAGACQAPYPPGWVPPVISALTLTSSPVTAGGDFTVSATIRDDKIVQSVELYFEQPDRTEPAVIDCTPSPWSPQQVVQVEFSCTIADFALNGVWKVHLGAYDGEVSTAEGGGKSWASTTFEVTGGSNDQASPAVESVTYSPAPPVAGQSFTATVVATDYHFATPPRSAFFAYSNSTLRQWDCTQLSAEVLSPTRQQWVFNCPAVATFVPGTYWSHFVVTDLNRNGDSYFGYFDMVAAP